MHQNKIRLHKMVTQEVKRLKLEFTQSEIQRNIEKYGVLIEKNLSFNRLEWVWPSQSLSLRTWPVREKGDFEKIQILWENDASLLIFKPKNVVVESGAGHRQDNLLVHLQQKQNNPNLSLAHRLDKDTQGLLLLAKNPTSLEFLQNQFRLRHVEKKYLAVVQGKIEQISWVKLWQIRDPAQVLRQKVLFEPSDPQARNSHSIIYPRIICPELNLSLIEVKILTGRMHQIRLHCETLGFPLFADKIYNRTTDSDWQQNQQNQQNLQIFQNLQNQKDSKKQAASQVFSYTEMERGLHSFFPPYAVIEQGEEQFLQLKKEIFGETDYCLLSNYLRLKLENGYFLEAEFKDLSEFI